jgi:hypothetical protein
MNTRSLLWIAALSGMLFIASCAPVDRYYYDSPSSYGGYPAYYGGSAPYYGGLYEPYYEPYAAPYRSHSHAEEHVALEHKYDKAMNRLDRQEREAEQKLSSKYRGNTADPHFQEQTRKIDRKYDYKRGKVERNVAKEHEEYHGW